MGKGDIKSKRGKINRGTSGVKRQKKKSVIIIPDKPKAAPKKKVAAKKTTAKKTTTKKTTTKKKAAKKTTAKKKAED
ncbi:MAG: 30S ribosomal protein THX [Bacteroidetes bacterium MED-G21]|nr:MAG: 30S ribosomal protein THX [Bacteroidetes bacterium MED-G21]